jgi:hypothetical protein
VRRFILTLSSVTVAMFAVACGGVGDSGGQNGSRGVTPSTYSSGNGAPTSSDAYIGLPPVKSKSSS